MIRAIRLPVVVALLASLVAVAPVRAAGYNPTVQLAKAIQNLNKLLGTNNTKLAGLRSKTDSQLAKLIVKPKATDAQIKAAADKALAQGLTICRALDKAGQAGLNTMVKALQKELAKAEKKNNTELVNAINTVLPQIQVALEEFIANLDEAEQVLLNARTAAAAATTREEVRSIVDQAFADFIDTI